MHGNSTPRLQAILLYALLFYFLAHLPQTIQPDQACALPCWYGLQVGSSTYGETLAALRALPFVDRSVQPLSTGDPGGGGSGTLQWMCRDSSRGACGTAVFESGRLVSLWTSAGIELTFRTAAAQLGPPEFAGYTPRPTGGGCTVNLYWPARGAIAGASVAKSCPTAAQLPGLKVSPVFRVDSLYLGSAQDPLFHRDVLALSADWQGFRGGPALLFDYLPGDTAAWLVGTAGLLLLVLLGLALPRLPAALIGFPLAVAVATLPIRQFMQFDNPGLDVLARGNTLFISGLVFTFLVMGLRKIKYHHKGD